MTGCERDRMRWGTRVQWEVMSDSRDQEPDDLASVEVPCVFEAGEDTVDRIYEEGCEIRRKSHQHIVTYQKARGRSCRELAE